MTEKKNLTPSAEEVSEFNLADFDKSIVDLGITLTNEAVKATNPDYKFKLIDAIVKLRGALPPMYLKR